MKEAVTKQIGTHTVVISPLPTLKALKLLPLIMKASSVGLLEVSGEELEQLSKGLLATVTLDDVSCLKIIDIALQGEISLVILLLAACIEVNYGDFTEDAQGLEDKTPKQSS